MSQSVTLVDKSLVVVEDGGLRYGMLEPVRQYGQEKLKASAEADHVRRRHAFWYLELVKGAEPWLRGARRKAWLEREHDNLRAALSWALERGEAELGLWFGGALGEFWYLSEVRRWLEAALANSGEAAPARTKALARARWIAWEQGDSERSMALSEASLALSRELEDEAGAATALSNLAWAEGKAMTLGEAVGYALAEGDEEQQARPRPPAPKEPPATKQPDDVLTRREREVALLVARGLTNRQIAGGLTISERTVTTHVDHILSKLGATSRAQVAAWIVEQRLLPEEARAEKPKIRISTYAHCCSR